MNYKKINDTYVIRIDRGEEILSNLTDFCKKEHVTLATVQGIGAADHAVIGLYDVGERKYHSHFYDEPLEITSLIGNITTKDGEVYLHLHVNMCRLDMGFIGGHLSECRISATSEIFVRTIDGTVDRTFDAAVTGLNLLDV
ncbi:MAG: DNA-binding protein [Lachnospiraceae bacterium]|nr:DNA-binding protein [Lachnospiraceae bacterium]